MDKYCGNCVSEGSEKVMSKNIEEIVESVLPLRDQSVSSEYDEGAINQNDEDRESLKQALAEKKLIRPLSEKEILKHFERYQEQHDEMNENSKLRAKCAKELYDAQFGGNK